MMKTSGSVSAALSVALNRRLGAYLAAAGATAVAGQADGAIVGNTTLQPLGVNGDVNIDFNTDGQIDYQIDHDRVDLGGGNVVDYLQIDKNDVNGAANPLPIDGTVSFPAGMTVANDTAEAGYVVGAPGLGNYPAALTLGTPIGPLSTFDFQEGTDFNGTGRTIRANRLIDEDDTQVDQILGGKTATQVYQPTNGPNWLGLNGDVRYLGVKMDLNNTNQFNYGWIGVRIDNEADATGTVVGYAYETVPGRAIPAGVIPEPGSMMLAAAGALALLAARGKQRFSKVAARK